MGYEQLILVHKSVIPEDIKMSAATLAYPQYTYQQLRWQLSWDGSASCNASDGKLAAVGNNGSV